MENVTIAKSEYLELLRYKEMVDVLEDLMHEPTFKESFIERVLEAEKRVKNGSKLSFNSIKEMSSHLDTLEE